MIPHMLGPLLARLGRWYERIAPHLIIPIGLIAATAMVVSASATVTNGQQTRRADADTAARDAAQTAVLAAQQELLDCFNEYAAAQSTGNTIVRRATVDQGDALRAVVAEIRRVFRAAVKGELTGVEQLRPIVKLSAAFEAASRRLDRARAENPVPDPPVTFCGD